MARVSLVQGIHEGQQETRCFISARLRVGNQVFILVTTHLDIAKEHQRLAQAKRILAHVSEQVEIARAETNYLRANNLMNRDYPFRDPVVIIGGDFNTVCAQDIDQETEEMLNRVNGQEEWEEEGEKKRLAYVDFVRMGGMCRYLTQNEHHGGYRYVRVGGG